MSSMFGDFLKQRRQEKSLTQKELARMLFVSESAVSKWEKNIAHPDITLLPKLSEILGVSEHELITASIDKQSREDKKQAKKWRALSFTMDMFFYISYLITTLVCFIVNLAVSGTLDWFWIVVSALVLSFSFINLPKFIKKHKLILLPISMFMSLVLLLLVCVIYTSGDWFWVATFSVFFGLIIIFTPIYISKLKVFERIKKYNDFVSIAVDFIMLNILLIVIDFYCVANGYANNHWYLSLALPIVIVIYLILNLFMGVRFLKINKLLKTSIILFMIDVLYSIAPFVLKSSNPYVQEEFESLNIFKANFSNWNIEIPLERNVHCITFLTILILAIVFFAFGLMKYIKNKTKEQVKRNS